MAPKLFVKQLVWRCSETLKGTDAKLISGHVATASCQSRCQIGWFSGATTAILGYAAAPSDEASCSTVVRFQIPVNVKYVAVTKHVRLVVACRRRFGGLHSRKKNAEVKILFNNQNLDQFQLKVIPSEHSDYFHRDDRPLPCVLTSVEECHTVYQWHVPKEFLQEMEACQSIEFRLAPDVSWDIDYVTILLGSDARKLTEFARSVCTFLVVGVFGAILVAVLIAIILPWLGLD